MAHRAPTTCLQEVVRGAPAKACAVTPRLPPGGRAALARSQGEGPRRDRSMAKRQTRQERYVWVAQPPPRERLRLDLLRPKAGRGFTCVIVSHHVEGILVH